MKHRNVIEIEQKNRKRREQIKTVTLSKRFLAAILSLVFIISVIPTGLYFSVAKAREEKVQEKEKVQIAETRNKGQEKTVIPLNDVIGRTEGPALFKVKLDGEEVGTIMVPAGRVTEAKVMEAIGKDENLSKILDYALYEGSNIEYENGDKDNIFYAGQYNGKTYYSTGENIDVGYIKEETETFTVDFRKSFSVTCFLKKDNGNEELKYSVNENGFVDENNLIKVEMNPSVERNTDKLMKVIINPTYDLLSVTVKGTKDFEEINQDLLNHGETELKWEEIEENLTFIFEIRKPEQYDVKSQVVNGHISENFDVDGEPYFMDFSKVTGLYDYDEVKEIIKRNGETFKEEKEDFTWKNSFKTESNKKTYILLHSRPSIITDIEEGDNTFKLTVPYHLNELKINGKKINLPKDPYLGGQNYGGSNGECNDSAAFIGLTKGDSRLPETRIYCIYGDTVNASGERADVGTSYQYLIEVDSIDRDLSLEAEFKPSVVQQIKLNCNEGIADTAGSHLTIFYRKGGDKGRKVLTWDNGFNYFYTLDHNRTGANIYDFYTVENLNSKFEKEIEKATFRYDMIPFGQPDWNIGAASRKQPCDEMYPNNVYMYKVKPGYNPYSVRLSNLKSDGKDILDETSNFGLMHKEIRDVLADERNPRGWFTNDYAWCTYFYVPNKYRPVQVGAYRIGKDYTMKKNWQWVYFAPIYKKTEADIKEMMDSGTPDYSEPEMLKNKIDEGLSGKWKFNFHDGKERYYTEPMREEVCGQSDSDSSGVWEQSRGYLRNNIRKDTEKVQFNKREKNTYSWKELSESNLSSETKSDLFELGILENTYSPFIEKGNKGDLSEWTACGVQGQNYLHSHWGSRIISPKHGTSGDKIEFQKFPLDIVDADINVNMTIPSEKTYYDPTVSYHKRWYWNGITKIGERNKYMTNFFPDVTNEKGFYFGFYIPEAYKHVFEPPNKKDENYGYNNYYRWFMKRTFHTPIAYGDNMELDVDASPYKYQVKYDLGNVPYEKVKFKLRENEKDKFTNIKNGKFSDKNRYTVGNRQFILPESAPLCNGKEFVGWELIKKVPGQKEHRRKVKIEEGKEKIYRPGDAVLLTPELMGCSNGKPGDKGILSGDGTLENGMASFDREEDKEKDDGLYYQFVAKWKDVDDVEIVEYTVHMVFPNGTSEDQEVILSDAGRKGTEIRYMSDIEEWLKKEENGRVRYYYFDEDNSVLSTVLGTGVENNLKLSYEKAPYVEIENKIKDENGGDSEKKVPVTIFLKDKDDKGITRACFGEIIKASGDRIPIELKFEEGKVTGIYERTRRLIADSNNNILLGNGDRILLMQIKNEEKVSVKAESPAGTNCENSYTFNNEKINEGDNCNINEDSEIIIESKEEPIVVTGILRDNPMAPLITAILLLLLYVGIVSRKQKN